MKHVIILLAVAVFAVTAYADENPNVRVFLTGATGDYVDQIDVPSGVPFNVYLAADQINTGLRGVAVTMLHNIPGFPAGVPVYIPAGTNAIGGFNDPNGWAMAWANCEPADPVTGILTIAEIPYFASGPGQIWIDPHPSDGYKTIDCNNVADFYCVLQNFGVGMEAPEGTCEVSPVENDTWGSIKGLYR